MSLLHLELRSFRNYRSLHLKLSPEITVFTGKNGVGKTTILEAISILGSGRSFRSAKNADFIHKSGDAAWIKSEITQNGLSNDLEVRIYPQGKKIFLDGKLARTTQALLDLLPVIVFSPGDHAIIEGDSNERKQFLNRAAANVDWEYAEDLSAYNKALLQRNRLLKDDLLPLARLADLLAPWDEQLVHYGARLVVRRNLYLHGLAPLAADEYRRISHTVDHFGIQYQALGEETGSVPCDTEREVADFFRHKLQDSMRRDQASGSTQVGPHKDEILLTLNGNKVKFYGSQGEKRTCALALRLGELALYREKARKMPVLLFDDVSSELDSIRRQSLVDLLKKEKTQVFITATELPTSLLGDVGKNFEQLDLHAVGERS